MMPHSRRKLDSHRCEIIEGLVSVENVTSDIIANHNIAVTASHANSYDNCKTGHMVV